MSTTEETADAKSEDKPAPQKGIKALIQKVLHNKKLLIIVIAVIVLIIGLAVFFIMKSGSSDPKTDSASSHASGHGKSDKDGTTGPVYIQLPQLLVNVNRVGKGSSFLKMNLTIEVASQEDAEKIKINMPRIQDSFNTYLRELRTDDVQGSAGIFRLREELLNRINKITNPAKVTDVLFQEIIMQ